MNHIITIFIYTGFNGFSACLRTVYVSFYDTEGVLQTVIKFEHSFNQGTITTIVEYVNEGALGLTGSVELDESQTWIANPPSPDEPWCFLLTKTSTNYELTIWTQTKYQTVPYPL